MTYEDIAIGAVTYLVGMALYAIWDLHTDAIELLEKWEFLCRHDHSVIVQLRKLIHANPSTRHAIQRRGKDGRFSA